MEMVKITRIIGNCNQAKRVLAKGLRAQGVTKTDSPLKRARMSRFTQKLARFRRCRFNSRK